MRVHWRPETLHQAWVFFRHFDPSAPTPWPLPDLQTTPERHQQKYLTLVRLEPVLFLGEPIGGKIFGVVDVLLHVLLNSGHLLYILLDCHTSRIFLHDLLRQLSRILPASILRLSRIRIPKLDSQLPLHPCNIPHVAHAPRNLVHLPLCGGHPCKNMGRRSLIPPQDGPTEDLPPSFTHELPRLVSDLYPPRRFDRRKHLRRVSHIFAHLISSERSGDVIVVLVDRFHCFLHLVND